MNKAIKSELVELYQEIAELKNKAHSLRVKVRAHDASVKRDVLATNLTGVTSSLNNAMEATEQAMDNCNAEFD